MLQSRFAPSFRTNTHSSAQAPTYSYSAVIDFSQLNTAQLQPVLLTAQAGQCEGVGGGGGALVMLLWLCFFRQSTLSGK